VEREKEKAGHKVNTAVLADLHRKSDNNVSDFVPKIQTLSYGWKPRILFDRVDFMFWQIIHSLAYKISR